MRIEVLFFGPARDLAGTERSELALEEGATVRDLTGALSGRYPGLSKALKSVRFAVNQSFATDDQRLAEGDEVAVIPPVSGGSEDGALWVELTPDPIDTARLRDFLCGEGQWGGVCTFEGVTRKQTHPEHGALKHLWYSAYESMARTEMSALALEARQRWGAGRVAVVHRLGVVPTGEVSVMIAVACPHRAEAFDACRFLIDALKANVPIWKKDVYEDGYTVWVEPQQQRRP